MSDERNGHVSPENYIDLMFSAGGLLAQGKADYKPREGQIRYARAVDRAIREKEHLLAEGPVGVGKSFGYSVPASFHASQTGKPIVIVTANIALQEQIIEKDLPLIQSIAPWKFTFALLKGRSNYLCLNALRDHEADVFSKRYSSDRLDPNGKRHLKLVESWAEDARREPLDSDGDKSELPFEPGNEIWRRFSVTPDECLGDSCKFADDCFANRALEIARHSHVIVTNYHMLFAHLRVFATTGLDLILPMFDTVILDEAHKAADIARDFFGIKPISEDAITRSVSRVRKTVREARSHLDGKRDTRSLDRFYDDVDAKLGEIGQPLETAIEQRAGGLFRVFDGIKRDHNRYKGHLTGHYGANETHAWTELREKLYLVSHIAEVSTAILESAITGPPIDPDDDIDREPWPRDSELIVLTKKVKRAGERLAEIISDIGQAMDPATAPKQVFYLEENEKRILSLRSRLVFASDALSPWLFNRIACGRLPDGSVVQSDEMTTVIATSATIAIKQTDFTWVAKELGVDLYETITVDSPFDFWNQAILIAPMSVVSPKDTTPDAFHNSVAEHIERIIMLAGGRTLCLFTSNKSMNNTFNRISEPCRKQGIRVLKQGDAPRTKLIEDFKSDVRSVLLGVESFWAGVDVPGEACSVVIIDRFPFPTPDDPVISKISESDKRWFFKYSVPRAIIQVQQGAGRLIRSVGDRGVLVVLDTRIGTTGYGNDFRLSLPKMRYVGDMNLIPDWLKPPAWDDV